MLLLLQYNLLVREWGYLKAFRSGNGGQASRDVVSISVPKNRLSDKSPELSACCKISSVTFSELLLITPKIGSASSCLPRSAQVLLHSDLESGPLLGARPIGDVHLCVSNNYTCV